MGLTKLGGFEMNTTPPRFNAPIPEYADLNFLFYRWGYSEITQPEVARKMFLDLVSQYVESGSLLLNVSGCYEALANYHENIYSVFEDDFYHGVEWISYPDLVKKGFDFLPNYQDATVIDLSVKEDVFFVRSVAHKGKKYYFLETKLDENGCSDDMSDHVMRPKSLSCNAEHLVVKKDELLRFEQQHLGIEHGLDLTDTEPKPLYSDKESENYAIELDIAIQAHKAVVIDGWRAKTNYGGYSGHLKEWLESKYPNASGAFIKRVTTVANPKKEIP